MLLLSNPAFLLHTVYSEVGTLQVAPTILKLGSVSHSSETSSSVEPSRFRFRF